MLSMRISDLLKAGVHFGHRTRFWDPKMAPYIYGSRGELHIINLEKTLPLLEEAANYVGHIVANHGTILFVGTKRAARESIAEQAKRCGMPYVDHRWLGGMLTNYRTVRQSIKRLDELEAKQNEGLFNKLSKKEALSKSRALQKLQRSFGGIRFMKGLPDALFVIDVGFEKIAVQEACKLKIPVIGVVDSNTSPEHIKYVIPGNDDSIRAIALYTKVMADAILEAKQASQQVLAKEDEYVKVVNNTNHTLVDDQDSAVA